MGILLQLSLLVAPSNLTFPFQEVCMFLLDFCIHHQSVKETELLTSIHVLNSKPIFRHFLREIRIYYSLIPLVLGIIYSLYHSNISVQFNKIGHITPTYLYCVVWGSSRVARCPCMEVVLLGHFILNARWPFILASKDAI